MRHKTRYSSFSKLEIRIVDGSDHAGHAYKTALEKELENHAGVARVLNAGVHDADDPRAYPHSAVDAVKMIKSGEVRKQDRSLT